MANVLITGSSSGFGELTVRTLLQKGHSVAATMRQTDTRNAEAARRLRNIAAETPGTLHVFDLDVTSTPSVGRAVDQALEALGGIDVAVNNAGYGVGGYMETVTDDQLQELFEVNLFGVQRVMRAVLPSMRKAGRGLIINVSSIMGRIVIPFATAYTASKYALEGLSESYHYELAGSGVDVVLVEPGGFGTNFMANMAYGADRERLESYGPQAERPNQMWSAFGQLFQADDAPKPQAVADAVLHLIETPPGQRPLRTVVDPLKGGEGPMAVNRVTDKIQVQLLESMEMQDMLSVKP
jgi:NAD(P)-dependent dehydrogenase (short-subunit alcohol dehydrogenase family)